MSNRPVPAAKEPPGDSESQLQIREGYCRKKRVTRRPVIPSRAPGLAAGGSVRSCGDAGGGDVVGRVKSGALTPLPGQPGLPG